MFKQENIDAISIALAVIDRSGNILHLNSQCNEVISENKDSAIGRNFFELLSFDEKLEDIKKLFERLIYGDLDTLDLLQDIETKSSKGNLISWKFSLIRDKKSSVEALLCLGIDITKQKNIEDTLYIETEEQMALNSILSVSLEDISLEEQLQKALDILLSLSWLNIASKGGIFLADNKSKTLLLKVQKHLNQKLLSTCAQVPFGYCLCGRAAASGEIQYSCCLDERHDISFEGMESHGHYNVPILSKQGVLGVIVVYLQHGHLKQEREVAFLKSVANTLSGLIKHHKIQDKLYNSREKLSQVQQLANLGGIEWDIENNEIILSDEAKLILSVKDGDKSPTFEEFLKNIRFDDRNRVKHEVEAAVKSGASFSIEYRIVKLDKSEQVIRSVAKPIIDNSGRVIRLSGTMQDITERKHMEERLSQSATIFENTSEAVVITDSAGKIISVNRSFSDITGYTQEELINKRASVLKSAKHDEKFYKDIYNEIKKRGNWHGEIWSKRKNGDMYPEWLNVSTVKDVDGRVLNYIGVFSDISAVKESQQKLDYLAHYDSLSGLPNRLLLNARAEQSLSKARRNNSMRGVLFLDLDYFKNVNNTFGHPTGDLLLLEVSSRLKGCVREEDTVSRLGGDEFVILIEDMKDSDCAGVIAHKVIDKLSEKYIIEGHEIFITCSVGISIFPNDGNDVSTLFKNADIALYRAKNRGRNTYEYYTKELSARAIERMIMENNLRYALDRGELSVYYQPQVDLYSGEIVGMEALLRWFHPQIGFIPPDTFIPLAEETGLIIPIGDWVLKTACSTLKSWIDEGLPEIRVAVNLSSRQFNQENLPQIITDILQETGLESRLLEIELTERIVMEDAKKSIKMITELKKLNIEFSIDDFGTGYSSLSYLKKFPINRIKIDKSFVDNIVNNSEDAAISQAIISMSHSMNLQTIAEGVETAEQLEFLRQRECDEIQGYYFSRPLPEVEMQKLLRKGTKVYRHLIEDEEEKHLLIVSNQVDVVNSIVNILSVGDYQISIATSYNEAMNILAIKPIRVVICDNEMSELEGVELFGKVYKSYPGIVRILLIKDCNVDAIVAAVNKSSVYKILFKEFIDKKLREYVKSAFLSKK